MRIGSCSQLSWFAHAHETSDVMAISGRYLIFVGMS